MLIGITGSIGCGKSLVADRLSELLAAPVLKSDDLCRELMEPGKVGYHAFIENYGTVFLKEDGTIDRVALRKAVFEKPSLRLFLESILHPLVRKAILETQQDGEAGAVVIVEIPLLFESGWQDDFDLIIAVWASRDVAMERVIRRDNTDSKSIAAIIESQMDLKLKCEAADCVIDNSGTWSDTERQLVELSAVVLEKMK